MKRVQFKVLGEPQGKARARTVKNAYTGQTMSYTPEQTVLYENLIKMEYQAQCGGVFFGKGVPIGIQLECWCKQPKSKKKPVFPCKKPDTDNILKAVADALNGVAWYDDAQIVCANVYKLWATEQPSITVSIWEVGKL